MNAINVNVGAVVDMPKHTEDTLSEEIQDLQRRIDDIRGQKIKAKKDHERNLNSIAETRKALASMEEKALSNNYEGLLNQESGLMARLTNLQNQLAQLTK